MIDFWFGWPAVIASLVSTGLAFHLRRPVLMALGAALAAPFGVYVSVYAGIAAPLSVALYLGGAAALMLKRPRTALLLLAPFLVIVAWIAVLVLRQ
jgi:hypothetical protein